MKKTLTMSLAALGIAGMVGGGTFATWSDFANVAGNTAQAGALVLNADTTAMTTNGGGGPLAPGENKTTWKYVANRSDNTVSLQDALLSLKIVVTADDENGCASNGEAVAEGGTSVAAADGACASGADTGELDTEAYLQIRKGTPSTTIDDAADCASAATSAVGAAKTLRGWETTTATTGLTLGTLDPGQGMCIGFEYGLKGAGIAPPGIDFGTQATNASQGDSATWDVRLDLVQQ